MEANVTDYNSVTNQFEVQDNPLPIGSKDWKIDNRGRFKDVYKLRTYSKTEEDLITSGAKHSVWDKDIKNAGLYYLSGLLLTHSNTTEQLMFVDTVQQTVTIRYGQELEIYDDMPISQFLADNAESTLSNPTQGHELVGATIYEANLENRDVMDKGYVTEYVHSNPADTQFEVFFPATGKFWLAYSEKEIRDLSIDDFISVRQRVSAEMMNTIYRLHKVALQLVPSSIYLEYRHMFEVNPGTLAMTTYAKVS